MPTFPLYEPRNTPAVDAWHQVAAPGGYEWWHFDAEHSTQDIQIVATFFEGFVFHPGYLRAYRRYRRHPTRIPPPLPAHYPCAHLAIYEHGTPLAQFLAHYPQTDFRASAERADVSIGPNTLTTDSAGLRLAMCGTPWRLTALGPRRGGCDLRADLAFRPRFNHPLTERTFLSRGLTGAEHRWLISNPLCHVDGELRFGQRIIPFTGRGYHDHHYGTGPLALSRWIRGRVLLEDRAIIFHAVEPSLGPAPTESHLILADASGIRHVQAEPPSMTDRRRTASLLSYPRRINFPATVELTHPRLVNASPFQLRLQYDALLHARPAGRAFCEITYPHRLRWPILGRMIERSIDRGDKGQGTWDKAP